MSSQMVDSQGTFSRLLEHLDYASSTNLITRETPGENIPAERETTWREARDKLGIDAIYFVADAPDIYFKRFEVPDQVRMAELHRNVWSQSKIPLLFIILPGDIRIYSGYEPPKRGKSSNEFIEPSRLERKLDSSKQRTGEDLWQRINIFTRLAIESGSFWREYSDSKYFKKTTRADQKLVANLRYIRRKLINDLSAQLVKYHGLGKDGDQQQIKEISAKYANNLIGRSIFALYFHIAGF